MKAFVAKLVCLCYMISYVIWNQVFGLLHWNHKAMSIYNIIWQHCTSLPSKFVSLYVAGIDVQRFIFMHNGLCSTNYTVCMPKSYSTPSLLLHVCVGKVLKRNWQERWTEFRKFEAMLHVCFSNPLFMSHTVWCYACVQYQECPWFKMAAQI